MIITKPYQQMQGQIPRPLAEGKRALAYAYDRAARTDEASSRDSHRAILSLYCVGIPSTATMAHVADDGFRWRARFWHLTYCGHVDFERLLLLLGRLTSIRTLCTSVVHECSNAEVPYDHTHLAWMWERAPNLHGSRLMDVDFDGCIVHPHMVHKKSLKWQQHIFLRYHHGHKVNASGKPILVPPVAGPLQVLSGFEWNDLLLTEVSEAPDLIEGAQLAGVGVRSLHDVMLLQQAKRPRHFEHNFARDSFLPLALPEAFATRAIGTLHIWGAVRLGKSEWALAQFENPLYVTERNDLLDFREGWHDGIVIDKLTPRERPPGGFTLSECERLTDFTLPASIKCLYRTARIPRGVPKIVVSNVRDVWPEDPEGQIVGRRVVQMFISRRLYE
tara:strand:- start:72 stop:1238 length:1167 start_codon:yes stop_codon:yes gene_type:complete